MASVLDCVTSFVDGRIRLRHPMLKDPALMEIAGNYLENAGGVTAVQRNPASGSLLIFYEPEKLGREDLLAFLRQAAEFLGVTDEEAFKSGNASCGKTILKRIGTGKAAGRVMLASLLLSLGGIAAGAKSLHTAAGGVFALACLCHAFSHRKAL